VGVLTGAVVWAGTVFLAWALARELAPEREGLAFVAMALAGIALPLTPTQTLLPAGVLLLSARLIARTVGPPLRTVDAAVVAGIALWAAATPTGWTATLAAAVAFALDRRGAEPGPRRHAYLALLLAAAAAASALLQGDRVPPATLPVTALGILGLIAYAGAVVRTRTVDALADQTGLPLDASRVRRAMLLPLVVLAPSLGGLAASPDAFAAVWAPVLAIAALGSTRAARS
ncbi:MAG: hypothetical protein KJP18_17305, partial [Gemmatimonadetes bacterium]|nr:hypothetical protein [Gemmatimonadota bacterium]